MAIMWIICRINYMRLLHHPILPINGSFIFDSAPIIFKLINSFEQFLKLFSAYLHYIMYVFSVDKDLRGATSSS